MSRSRGGAPAPPPSGTPAHAFARKGDLLMNRVSLALAVLLLVQLVVGAGRAGAQTLIGPSGPSGLTFAVPAISTRRVWPAEEPSHGELTDRLALMATPGEYEPASFVIYALTDLEAVHPQAGDLVNGEQVISAANVDIKLVKRWFQAGTAWWGRDQDKSRRVLVPELLLNDPYLVRVDPEKQENYLKCRFADRTEYVWISDPTDRAGRQQLLQEQLPVQDSPVLLPVDIAAQTNEQFWVTVRVPADTPPGTYKGQIALYAQGSPAGELQLELTVLPFVLAAPYYTSSIYYRGVLDPTGVGSISSERKTRQQYVTEMKDMVAHGVTNPIIYQPLHTLEEVLRIRGELGLNHQPLYYLGVRTYDPVERVQEALALAKRYGIPEVYFYAIDEAAGQELANQREAFRRVHAAGGKVFTASYKPGAFELVGDLLDLLVNHGRLSQAEAAKWHSAGQRIWSYGNPQSPPEDPDVFRRNYGLLLWKNGYDGAATYAYQDGFGSIWNDFDHPTFRDHNFTYPTVDGVIGTIAWEGYREGVDDVRYLTTLLQSIDAAESSADTRRLRLAGEARAYLAGLSPLGNLDEIRRQLIDYILRLRAGEAEGR